MQSRSAIFFLVLVALSAFVSAKGGEGESGGGGGTTGNGRFVVTINGVTYGASGRDKVSNIKATGNILVRGTHVWFDISASTLGVYNYTLTGANAPDRMVTSPTVIFASKVPTLTAAQKAGATIKEMEVRDDNLVLIFLTSAGKIKVQAKDKAQGGIFQQEPEFANNVELVHTLGSGIFYFVNSFTGKVNFGNGVNASTAAPAHEMLLGKDSPQVANKTFQSSNMTKWTVGSGGRMGGVLGEDAIELSQGATQCTSHCQAQNRIQDSLPVPPNPVNPVPISSSTTTGAASTAAPSTTAGTSTTTA